MIANYHTHTYRCCHAEGDVRDYVEEAVNRGLSILGISVHRPGYKKNRRVDEDTRATIAVSIIRHRRKQCTTG